MDNKMAMKVGKIVKSIVDLGFEEKEAIEIVADIVKRLDNKKKA
jgi:hypothetical protein